MGNVLERTVFPINSTAKKFVRLRPLFPQIKKALALPSGLFSRQGPGSIFQNATLKNLHLFPLAFRNSAGANISPIRPDLKRGLRQSACDFYCTCRTALQPNTANPIRFYFFQRTWRLASKPPANSSHPKTRGKEKRVAAATLQKPLLGCLQFYDAAHKFPDFLPPTFR